MRNDAHFIHKKSSTQNGMLRKWKMDVASFIGSREDEAMSKACCMNECNIIAKARKVPRNMHCGLFVKHALLILQATHPAHRFT
jgi:hypothetical protein